MKEKIYNSLRSLGVSDIGFFTAEDAPEGLGYGITLVVKLSSAIIDEIKEKPTHTYFNHYRTVNAFIDQALLQCGILLSENGYRYITIAASQSINIDGWSYKGRYSHKKGAVLSGMGSIGKSCLFIHKDFGAAVRLGTIFTDCHFDIEDKRVISPCGECDICENACPAKAILGREWSSDTKREDFFKADYCSEYMKKAFKDIGRGAVCGICISSCPKKY